MSKTKKKTITIAVITVAVCLIAGIILFVIFGLNRSMMSKLSPGDQETANLYAELYEMPAEEIAKIQVETGDWEETGKQLNDIFFRIPENTKYQMVNDGYSLDDLEQAEKLSEKTGIKAIELAERKGRIEDNRKWSDIVSDDEMLSSEELQETEQPEVEKKEAD